MSRPAVVDCNAYHGTWGYWPLPGRSPAQFAALLDKGGIGAAVAASLKSVFVDAVAGNAETEALHKALPDRVIPCGVLNPLLGEPALTDFRRRVEAGWRAFRIYPQHHGYRPDDEPLLERMLGQASELGLLIYWPVRLSMNWGFMKAEARDLERVAARYPGARFVLSGVNYGEFRDALTVLRNRPNVVVETSCAQFWNAVASFVREAGPERVLMGTALPTQYPECNVVKIETAEISDQARELILGANARRLLART